MYLFGKKISISIRLLETWEYFYLIFRLWLPELLELWDTCQIMPSWEGNLVSLFARLAINNVGYIDWEPWIPKIFTRILRSLSLPVGTNKVQVTRAANNSYDIVNISIWIASMLGGGSCCQSHVSKLFKGLESFYHPSNFGKWIVSHLNYKQQTYCIVDTSF